MTTPEIKSNAPIKATPGMSVKTVKTRGNEAQQLAVSLFDLCDKYVYDKSGDITDMVRDGHLDKKEAELFNSFNMELTDLGDGTKNLTMKNDKKSIEIRFKDFEEVKESFFGIFKSGLGAGMLLGIGNNCYDENVECNYKRVALDFVANKAEVDGAKNVDIDTVSIDVTIKNSQIDELSVYGGVIAVDNSQINELRGDDYELNKKNVKINNYKLMSGQTIVIR